MSIEKDVPIIKGGRSKDDLVRQQVGWKKDYGISGEVPPLDEDELLIEKDRLLLDIDKLNRRIAYRKEKLSKVNEKEAMIIGRELLELAQEIEQKQKDLQVIRSQLSQTSS